MHIDQIEKILGSGGRLVTIVASDSTVYDPPIRALRVAVAGNLAVVGEHDTDPVVIPGVLAGETIVASIKQVLDTDTDASGFTGYY